MSTIFMDRKMCTNIEILFTIMLFWKINKLNKKMRKPAGGLQRGFTAILEYY